MCICLDWVMWLAKFLKKHTPHFRYILYALSLGLGKLLHDVFFMFLKAFDSLSLHRWYQGILLIKHSDTSDLSLVNRLQMWGKLEHIYHLVICPNAGFRMCNNWENPSIPLFNNISLLPNPNPLNDECINGLKCSHCLSNFFGLFKQSVHTIITFW